MPIPDNSHSRSDAKKQEDSRSSYVQGYVWATVIITMAVELVVPILLGVYADYKFGTKGVFLLLGVFLSCIILVTNFVKLMKSKDFHQMGGSNKDEKQGKTGK